MLYFLESDYSINEDYVFEAEDTRQFYLRREILRAIASHTCKDIYQLDLNTFSFLLQLCDDAQEWGRKGISELYVDNTIEYEFDGISIDFSEKTSSVSVRESYNSIPIEAVQPVLESFLRQCTKYRDVFRDGQETTHRNFDFEKSDTIKIGNVSEKDTYKILLKISNESRTEIIIIKDGKDIQSDDKFLDVTDKAFKVVFDKKCFNEYRTEEPSPKMKSVVFTLP